MKLHKDGEYDAFHAHLDTVAIRTTRPSFDDPNDWEKPM
jgi:hypothetical protein